jgi:hypothetical protein
MRSGIAFKVKEDMTLAEFKTFLHASELAMHRHLAIKGYLSDEEIKVEDILIRVDDNKIKLVCNSVVDTDTKSEE